MTATFRLVSTDPYSLITTITAHFQVFEKCGIQGVLLEVAYFLKCVSWSLEVPRAQKMRVDSFRSAGDKGFDQHFILVKDV